MKPIDSIWVYKVITGEDGQVERYRAINGAINKKKNKKRVACKLIKSLYGLKQAPRRWNRKFVKILDRFRIKENKGDKCVFLCHY